MNPGWGVGKVEGITRNAVQREKVMETNLKFLPGPHLEKSWELGWVEQAVWSVEALPASPSHLGEGGIRLGLCDLTSHFP